MNRVPFDLKYKDKINSGRYPVQTKDGHNVRVICWDASDDFPIVVVDSGIVYQYDISGKPMIQEDESDDLDLVVITKTEEEENIIAILKGIQNGYYEEDSKNDFKDTIEQLKEYVKKEIFRDLPIADLEEELRCFHDTFNNKEIDEVGLKNWASLMKTTILSMIERERLNEK